MSWNEWHFKIADTDVMAFYKGAYAVFECADWGTRENCMIAARAFAAFGGTPEFRSVGKAWFESDDIAIDFKKKTATQRGNFWGVRFDLRNGERYDW